MVLHFNVWADPKTQICCFYLIFEWSLKFLIIKSTLKNPNNQTKMGFGINSYTTYYYFTSLCGISGCDIWSECCDRCLRYWILCNSGVIIFRYNRIISSTIYSENYSVFTRLFVFMSYIWRCSFIVIDRA